MTPETAPASRRLAEKEGWFAHCEKPPRPKPAEHSAREISAMNRQVRAAYERERADWHANLGPIKTPQVGAVHEELWELLATNRQDVDRVRSSAALDAEAGIGKTTAAVAFGKEFHREEIDVYGPETQSGHQRIPVAFIPLPGHTTTRIFSSTLCNFYAHPGAERGTAAQLIDRAADCVLACETKLLIIDDVHFLSMQRTDHRDVANYFKSLVNTLPLTLLVVGIELDALLNEGLSPGQRARAQNSRRLTPLKLSPFSRSTEQARAEWRQLLKTIEHQLVLANKHEGMLFRDLDDYLFARTQGYFTSLMSLIARGCFRAARSGTEHLDENLLSSIRLDAAAERMRPGRTPAAPPGTQRPQTGTRRRRDAA
ncbi:MAG TPA: ATP-binding protein [Mycobacteriales bacterium]|nr:ATP-binding protein [Mycobacteriales bacterium]